GEISGKWQAAKCAGPNDRSSGSSFAHRSCANGPRVRNRHSDGGVIALGTSPATPARTLAFSACGSATGAASISPLVYGCAGEPYTLSAGPTSTSLPRDMTPMSLDR